MKKIIETILDIFTAVSLLFEFYKWSILSGVEERLNGNNF